MRHRARGLVVVAAVAAGVLTSACSSSGGGRTGGGWFEARPLIMPGQPVTAVRADPFRSLRVPRTEVGYASLRRAERTALKSALRSVDCAHPPRLPGHDVRVVCDAHSEAFLLGAPLFTGDDVTQAMTIAPNGSVVGWQLSLTLTSAAADSVSQWTSQHHVLSPTGEFNDVQTSSTPPCGFTTTIECADFTAYISDKTVLTVPVTFAQVNRTIVINGDLDEALVTRLAHRLAG